MSQAIKKAVQNVMLMPRKNKYEKDYRSLLKEYEENRIRLIDYVKSEKVCLETKEKVSVLSAEEIIENGSDFSYEAGRFYIVFDEAYGMLKEETERIVFEYVRDDREAKMCYGDEDFFVLSGEYDEKKDARIPHAFRFFKPGYSPETLESFNYIGIFAAEGEILSRGLRNIDLNNYPDILLYELAVEICSLLKEENNTGAIRHIPRVLSSKPVKVTEQEYGEILKTGRCDRFLKDAMRKYELPGSGDRFLETRKKVSEKLGIVSKGEAASISVIIPSKDNPDMLISCIERMKLSDKKNAQLIIVDNGSSEENRRRIEAFLDTYKGEKKYIYDVFDFNYSKMNNMAAKEAKGDVLLLLNDDIEADGFEWADTMARFAKREGVGCVGCRLLYPDGKIQHVGITGGVDGPAHIHMGESDEENLGFGDNRVSKNVLAVTGACLALRKELFDEAGGLFEELKVGYNDVDLCMNLYEKGFRNILLNEIKLIHHESVTRGKDAKSKAKSLRLKNEKDILKKRHEKLMTADPYQSAKEDFLLDFERENSGNEIKKKGSFGTRKANDEEGWIYSSFERFEVTDTDGKKVLSVKGFLLVPGIDNMRFDFEMILENESKQYLIPIERKLRTDLFNRFNGSENTHLCGMEFAEDLSELPAGTYDVKMYAKDHGNVREIISDTGQMISLQ
ncbi:MAG: glycosyltransferase [Lachnospiraceae bacterium]|nr:glycosyltransferase [Lachnospiraceae bacterium]